MASPAVSYVQNVLISASLEQLADKSILVAVVMVIVRVGMRISDEVMGGV